MQFKISVTALVPDSKMDHDDLNEDGSCSIPGDYAVSLTNVPEGTPDEHLFDCASYAFHSQIAISCLDYFDIDYEQVDQINDNEMEDTTHDLGDFDFNDYTPPED